MHMRQHMWTAAWSGDGTHTTLDSSPTLRVCVYVCPEWPVQGGEAEVDGWPLSRCAGADIDALGFVFLRAPTLAVLSDVAYSGLPTDQVSSACAVHSACTAGRRSVMSVE